ncbi:MAG TPA: PGPGW domain-containing protein [Candidatus Saccharimonadales bacterium]|nr:PGPGW domain-containing protein [Candidatus Saccharimonadales bacterium]
MEALKRNAKRVLTDAAGYGLIVLGVALGWLPGPGGIPLVLAGLGLLSVNNAWARRLRGYLLKHGGRIAQFLFPPNPFVQWLYDALAVLLLIAVGILGWKHAAIWQVSLAAALFFIALFIAALNRDRWSRIKQKR